MKTMLKIVQAGAGMLAIGFSCSAALAAPSDGSAAQITLVSTDTSEPFPFATLIVDNITYHVTEGDIVNGLHVRQITPGRVTLSDNEVLAATQPNLDSDNAQVVSRH